MTETAWVSENLVPPIKVEYQFSKELHQEQTPYQSMRVVESAFYGRMLLLDGIVQTTEKDEFVYHEMLTQVPLMAHPAPERVLIIGGGDGGMLRETLRHPGVRKAVLVEIDERVVEISKKFLPSISGGCFADPRVEALYCDGARYVKETSERFDVVLVDSSDPIGPATVLFQKEFYADIAQILTPDGVLVRQTGSTFLQPEEQANALEILREVFRHNALYVFPVPTYIGGFFSASFSSQTINPLAVTEEQISERFGPLRGQTNYYNPEAHVAAFKLPEYVKKRTILQ